MKVLKFGEFKVVKGETDDPKDIWIDVINFEFDTEDQDYTPQDTVIAICDYITSTFKHD